MRVFLGPCLLYEKGCPGLVSEFRRVMGPWVGPLLGAVIRTLRPASPPTKRSRPEGYFTLVTLSFCVMYPLPSRLLHGHPSGPKSAC